MRIRNGSGERKCTNWRGDRGMRGNVGDEKRERTTAKRRNLRERHYRLVIVGMDRLEVLYLEINLNILIKFY